MNPSSSRFEQQSALTNVSLHSAPLLVSVITVVYNGAECIADCMRSVVRQDYPHIEYLIIDGNSSDGTQDIVQKEIAQAHEKLAAEKRVSQTASEHEKITKTLAERDFIFISERDNGIYDAMNKGIARARGQWIAFMNADDMFAHPHVISDAIAAAHNGNAESTNNTKNDIKCVYGDVLFVDRFSPGKIFRYWKSRSMYANFFHDGEVTHMLAMLFHRDIFAKLHGFDTQFRIASDYDLMLRIFLVEKFPSRYVPSIFTLQRLGGVSNASAKNVAKGNLEILRSWRRLGLGIPFFTLFFKRPFKKIRQIFHAETAPKIPNAFIEELR